MKNADLNEISYTELILWIDGKSISGKIFSAISKDVSVKTIPMEIPHWLGIIPRRDLILFLPLR
jgi:hypothetical protein